ncbi:hypothetical protein N7535_009223 [Penicillium sp. DV-2018c]|nr:hypothetical protein N7535_009223 [Penicillium sp. DV-2018c]
MDGLHGDVRIRLNEKEKSTIILRNVVYLPKLHVNLVVQPESDIATETIHHLIGESHANVGSSGVLSQR